MLPQHVFQLDYQDYSDIVHSHLDKIIEFEELNEKFDLIIAKSRSGLFAASIISNYLNIPMGIIEINRTENEIDAIEREDLFFPKVITKKLKNNLTVLFIDSTCQTGKTLETVKDYFQINFKNFKFYSYSTLVNKESNEKPNICGMEIKEFIQPPWEWLSFTPQTHLERLETGKTKTNENGFCVGICSEDCKEELTTFFSTKSEKTWLMTFSNPVEVMSASGISSLSLPESLSFEDAQNKYNNIIKEKTNFILLNGLTHFIETDLTQALLLSKSTPVCHIVFYNNEKFYKIYMKDLKNNFLFEKF